MNIRSVVPAGVLILCGMSTSAHAMLIEGSFTGRADVDFIDFVPGDGFLDEPLRGAPLSGTFLFQTESDATVERMTITNGVDLLFQTVQLTFTFQFQAGEPFTTLTFAQVPDITLRDDGTRQTLTLSTLDFFESASLELIAVDRNLFSNLDLTTFTPSPIDLSQSWARFNVPRFLSGTVMLDQIVIGGVGIGNVGVAEPSALALMMAALPLWFAWRRKLVERDRGVT